MQRRSLEISVALGAAIGLAVACGTNTGAPSASHPIPPPDADAGEGNAGAATGGTTGGATPIGRPRTSRPQGGEGGQGEEPRGGEGGSSGSDIVVPVTCAGDATEPPDVNECGDGYRAPGEECDDGNEIGDDACSSSCRVQDSRPFGAPAPDVEQTIGAGRHAIGAGCAGIAVAHVERGSDPDSIPSVVLTRFDRSGAFLGATRDVSTGSTASAGANPVVAELGGSAFAVAWTDFGGDGSGLGIALRRVSAATGMTGPLTFANSTTFAAQSDPDLLWTGDTLVAAWVDHSSLTQAPDLKLRRFSGDLVPLGEEEELAVTANHEADVALAPYRSSWAAAWRSSSEGVERIQVRANDVTWTVGPFAPGAEGDRPALAEVDSQHLLVVFSVGTDPTESGVADVPRLRGALLGTPGPTPSFEIAPTVMPYDADPSLGQSEPNVVRVADKVYVGWRSSPVVADPLGEELWLKEISLRVQGGNLVLDLGAHEVPLPRSEAHRTGDQRFASLFSVPFAFGGAFAVAWMDYGPFGAGASAPGPVFELIPAPVLRLPGEGMP